MQSLGLQIVLGFSKNYMHTTKIPIVNTEPDFGELMFLTPNRPLAHTSFTYRKLNMDVFSVLNGFLGHVGPRSAGQYTL